MTYSLHFAWNNLDIYKKFKYIIIFEWACLGSEPDTLEEPGLRLPWVYRPQDSDKVRQSSGHAKVEKKCGEISPIKMFSLSFKENPAWIYWLYNV